MSKYTWFLVVSTLVGVAVVIGGALLAIDGIETLCEKIGIPDKVAGLTVLAIGTSLPELITCTTAARKGETDIAVGNIVGSNIFNILFVIGTTALIIPVPFAANFLIDSAIAIFAAIFFTCFEFLKYLLFINSAAA